MLRRTLSLTLGILSFAAQQTAQDIQVFSGASKRQMARLGYWNPDSGMVGMLSLHYSDPVWKKEYDAMLTQAKKAGTSLRLRLGAGVWTTLNTDLELKIGSLSVVPGQYYLGLQVSEKGEFGLLIADASVVRKRKLSAASTDRLKSFVVARLKHRAADTSVPKLRIAIVKSEIIGRSELKIEWGAHVLTAPVLASLGPKNRKATRVEIDTAKTDLASISTAVQLFALRQGRIPSMAQLTDPNANPGGPYLQGYAKSAPTDPWGGAYAIEDLQGRLNYLVRSFGPDGKKGTDDDLVTRR